MARNIRSPMTDQMVVLIRAGNAGSDEVRQLEAAERAKLAATLFIQGGYVLVAHVDGNEPEFAFKATQNGVLSESWSRFPPTGVQPVTPNFHLGENGEKYGRKSTDIGDIIVMSDGRVLMVDKVGFTDLSNTEIQILS